MRQFLFIIFLGLVLITDAQTHVSSSHHDNIVDGLALQGYDPVAYFEYKAVKGSANITAIHNGVTYRFISENHKVVFLKDPFHFEPQYGGWCAFAMGDYAKKVEVNPETFKILEGKLYLFYNAYFTNTLNDWNKNEAVLKGKADQNWNNIKQK
jgi:YHS domain-containing protein